MADESFFLRSNSLDGLAEAAGPDGGLLDRFAAQKSLISSRCGPEAASLFAEPVITRNRTTGSGTVSWYSVYEGDPIRLVDLDPDARASAEAALSSRLQTLEPALTDREGGLGVSQSLHVPSLDDVYIVNGNPVLTNWGMAPPEALASEEARTDHFARTLGAFLPSMRYPPVNSAEWTAFSTSDMQAAAPREESQVYATAAEPGQVASAGAPMSPAAPGAMPVAPPFGAMPQQSVAWYRRPSLPLIIAVVVAALFLIYLLVPGVLIYPERAVARAPDAVADPEIRRQANAALRERLAELRKAHEKNVCSAEGDLLLPSGVTPRGLPPGPPGAGGTTPIPSQTLVPPDAADLKVPPETPGATPSSAKSVLNLLDSTTALVIRVDEKSGGTGTGFFVAPHLMVTNAHVVGKSPVGSKFFVANRVIGKPVPATVLHVSTAEKDDFAVLEVQGIADQPYLALGTTVERLDNVVAAGYPGILLRSDLDWHRLMKGDTAAIPQMAVTQGIVTVIQNMPGGRDVVAHTATISPGNSGGPLVDSCGRVVGINTFGRTEQTRTVYYAIHSESVAAFLDSKGVGHSKVADACNPAVTRAAAVAPGTGDGAAAGALPATPPVKK